MLAVKAWIYGKLAADASLITALGTVDRIEYYYPNVPTDLPKLTYSESNQVTDDYYDNTSKTVETTIEMHVWTEANTSTTSISTIVDTIMTGLLFNIDFSADFQEPDTRINHRIMRYRRKVTASDLV